MPYIVSHPLVMFCLTPTSVCFWISLFEFFNKPRGNSVVHDIDGVFPNNAGMLIF